MALRGTRGRTPDIDQLQAELKALRDEVESLVSDATSRGGRRLRQARDNAGVQFGELASESEALLSDLGREMRRAERRAVTTVREHPAQSIAVALGLGILLALLFRR